MNNSDSIIYNNDIIFSTNTSNIDTNEVNNNNKEPLGFLSFTIDVVSIILTQFLTIYDIGKLDTAYCNTMKREQLLSILSNHEFIVYDHSRFDESIKSIDKLMLWIGIRKINIAALTIENSYLTDHGLLGLCRNYNNLQSLNISRCVHITDFSMIEISRSCNNLRSLTIYECDNITDTSINEIARSCNNLQLFDISSDNITDSSLIAIARNCNNNIRSLSIWNCNKLTDITMFEIAKNCTQLQTLGIIYCHNITDSSMIEIARSCNNLRSLTISGYGNITDATMIEISKYCNNLQSLSIWNCNNITDTSMKKIGSYCNHLESLNIWNNQNITDESMIEIGKKCTKLNFKSLDINWCSNITDDSKKLFHRL